MDERSVAIPAALLIRPRWGKYPIPWFVTLEREGKPEFRVIEARRLREAMEKTACWICGEKIRAGSFSFLIGPMCTVNRNSAEPPQHLECSIYAAKTCPFMLDPKRVRREGDLPEGYEKDAGMIDRNPGVCAIWTCQSYRIVRGADQRWLFRLGDPSEVLWFTEGRPASRSEVEAAWRAGCPILEGMAEADGPKAVELLRALQERALRYWPAA